MNSIVIDLEQRATAMAAPAHRIPLRIDRAIQVAKNYRWSQMARRGWKLLRRRVQGNRPIAIKFGQDHPALRSDRAALESLAKIFIAGRGKTPSSEWCDLATGSIALLNERFELGSPIDWKFTRREQPSHLWRFQLQYQEFLLPLASDESSSEYGQIWRTLDEWIAAHEVGEVKSLDDSWHPYCISRRLPAWMWLLLFEKPFLPNQRVLHSLYAQANYLAANFELDPGGNHLLENYTALGLAGSFFDGAKSDSWLDAVELGLRSELPRQILKHGEHFERSPMYHCQVLANLLTLAHATKAVRPSLAEYCAAQARTMIAFVKEILHPDGEIPLFGDSGFGESPSIALLRELAEVADVEWMSVAQDVNPGPYWILKRGGSALIFDAGPVGPRELPAHSHCDLLGLEASIDGRRWFVDSGNFNYESDSMRRYCRSSVAHNVVVVDDREQCDVWSKFRMGFRGQPIRFETGQRAGADWAIARHNAYRRHRVRWLDRLLVGWGDVWMCGDFAESDRRPKLTGYLHLAPEVSVLRVGERRFELIDPFHRRRLDFFGIDDVEMGEGWYCPGFGRRVRNQCFVYRQSEGPLTSLGWLLDSVDAASSVELDGRRLFLRLATASFEWSFD